MCFIQAGTPLQALCDCLSGAAESEHTALSPLSQRCTGNHHRFLPGDNKPGTSARACLKPALSLCMMSGEGKEKGLGKTAPETSSLFSPHVGPVRNMTSASLIHVPVALPFCKTDREAALQTLPDSTRHVCCLRPGTAVPARRKAGLPQEMFLNVKRQELLRKSENIPAAYIPCGVPRRI